MQLNLVNTYRLEFTYEELKLVCLGLSCRLKPGIPQEQAEILNKKILEAKKRLHEEQVTILSGILRVMEEKDEPDPEFT